MPQSTDKVTDNTAHSRYELAMEGAVAFIDHVKEGDAVAFMHTEVPEAMAGKGIGSKLVRSALDDARSRGFKVVPRCPFVREYIERHPEYQDIALPVDRDQ